MGRVLGVLFTLLAIPAVAAAAGWEREHVVNKALTGIFPLQNYAAPLRCRSGVEAQAKGVPERGEILFFAMQQYKELTARSDLVSTMGMDQFGVLVFALSWPETGGPTLTLTICGWKEADQPRRYIHNHADDLTPFYWLYVTMLELAREALTLVCECPDAGLFQKSFRIDVQAARVQFVFHARRLRQNQ